MIPKIIHLCWFSDDPYPVEIKVCLDTWKHFLTDYKIKLWGYAEAKAIGCAFIDEEHWRLISGRLLQMLCVSMPC